MAQERATKFIGVTQGRTQRGTTCGQVRHGAPMSFSDDYLDELVMYFYSLTAIGRGDSARGRGLQVLYFLNYVWAAPKLPLYSYRPHRKPASFLAMAVDLYADLSHKHAELFFEGRSADVERSLKLFLQKTWFEFCTGLREGGLGRFADILDEVIRSALRNADQSDLPAELAQLDLYMTPAQFARFDRHAFIDHVPLHQLFAYLRFRPPGLWDVKSEQHPVGGDLRAAIRESYDVLWARVVTRVTHPNVVKLFAMLPINCFSLFTSTYTYQDEDFAVFYARLTDSRRPGRKWSPPAAYVGNTPEDREHFTFLTAGDKRDGFLRKAQRLERIGLSSTFPTTVAVFDAWLESPEHFRELRERAPWWRYLEHYRNDVTRERRLFLNCLIEEAATPGGGSWSR